MKALKAFIIPFEEPQRSVETNKSMLTFRQRSVWEVLKEELSINLFQIDFTSR